MTYVVVVDGPAVVVVEGPGVVGEEGEGVVEAGVVVEADVVEPVPLQLFSSFMSILETCGVPASLHGYLNTKSIFNSLPLFCCPL